MRISGRRWSVDIGYVCCWDARGVAVMMPSFYFDLTLPPIPRWWVIRDDCGGIDSSVWTGRAQSAVTYRLAWWRWRPNFTFWFRCQDKG